MKKGATLIVVLFLFSFFAAVMLLAQEQHETVAITVSSSTINNNVVILAVKERTRSFELRCNMGMSNCTVLPPGNYLMVRLPKNWGMYECSNVDIYRATASSEPGEKIGQYCIVEQP